MPHLGVSCVGYGAGSRNQVLIEAMSVVPWWMCSRLSWRVAAARTCLSLLKQHWAVFREAPDAGGRARAWHRLDLHGPAPEILQDTP